MKLTQRQQDDINSCIWFSPNQVEIKDQDKRDFLNISERGIKPKELTEGIKCLIEGKSWRGVHCDTSFNKETGKILNRAIYEEGVLSGDMPYYVILGGLDKSYRVGEKIYHYHVLMPRYVVNYLKKSLFGGMDAELIEEIYQFILNDNPSQNPSPEEFDRSPKESSM